MKFTLILQAICVLIAASILGNWYLAEFRKAKLANQPLYKRYFSLPGILILIFILLLPVIVRYI